MRRREFIRLISGAAAAWPLAARAQQPKIPKLGFLYPGPSTVATTRIDAFLGGLRAAGYRVPEEVEFISRFANGDPTRLAPMAIELVDQNVDVIAAVSTPVALAVRAATATIPIVAFDLETDPVATGMIASLARPGGNITGLFFDFPEFRTKLLELLKEVVPSLSKIAVIWDSNSGSAQLKSIEIAAEAIKVSLEKLEVRNAAEMKQAFDTAKRTDVDAAIILSSPFIGANAKLAAELTLSRKASRSDTFFRVYSQWGVDVVWTEHSRRLPPRRRYRCEATSGEQTCRSAGRVDNEFRARCEPQDC